MQTTTGRSNHLIPQTILKDPNFVPTTFIPNTDLAPQKGFWSGGKIPAVERIMDNFPNTFFSWLGMMQRTKLGFVFLRVAMSLDSCSLYSWPTVRNMPLRVLKAPGISDIPETLSRPTIRSTERCEKKKMRKETLGKKPAGFNFIIWISNQVNSIQMHVTRSNEWLLSLHFLVVNTNQERVEAIHTTRTSETPHKHRVNEGRETGVGRRMMEWSHKKPVKRGEITHHYDFFFFF